MAIRPDRLNEPLILATGAVVIWWGRIEGLMFQELMTIRKHPTVKASGECEVLHIATKRLIDQWAAASRLLAAGHPDLLKKISELKVELKDCAETRHIIVHGFWAYPAPSQDPTSCRVTVAKPQRDGKITIAQYDITYALVADFHDRLSRLYHQLLIVTLQAPFRDLGQRPKVELSEAEAKPADGRSNRQTPNRKRGVSLHRDSE